MAEFRLAPAAERDLESIWRYPQSRWGTNQADRYTDCLVNAFSKWANSPTSAARCDHIRAGYRRGNVESHVVYFLTMDYGISIVRVLHNRMDPARHL